MNLLLSLTIFILSVVIHECAHAWTAFKLGDSTAKRLGRLTLNPLAHIDPVGTIFLPILLVLMNSPVLFGWAKPVPVNFAGLRNPKKDMIWVGLSGPIANLLCAFIAAQLIQTNLITSEVFTLILQSLLIVNVVLAVFNLIPIPPLDGSRILLGLLPAPLARAFLFIERYGFLLLFALLYAGLFDRVVWPIAVLIITLFMKI